MTDQPLCPLCPPHRRRVLYDNAYVCRGCSDDVGRALERLEAQAGEAMVTVAKQSRTGAGGRRTSPDQPLPVNLGAGDHYDAAAAELLSRARMIAEERGIDLPRVRRVPVTCRHWTCQTIRSGAHYLPGPTCEDIPADHQLVVLATWLPRQLEWLRHHPDGEAALRDLRSACRTLERVIDRTADRWYAGPCGVDGCEEELYPTAGAKKIRCGACAAEHDPDERRQWLLGLAEDQLAIANWCAAMLTRLGIYTPSANVRKWAERGRLVSHTFDLQGRPLYRLGDVRDLAVEAAQYQAAKTVREAVKAARERASLTSDHATVTLGAQAEEVCPQPA